MINGELQALHPLVALPLLITSVCEKVGSQHMPVMPSKEIGDLYPSKPFTYLLYSEDFYWHPFDKKGETLKTPNTRTDLNP